MRTPWPEALVSLLQHSHKLGYVFGRYVSFPDLISFQFLEPVNSLGAYNVLSFIDSRLMWSCSYTSLTNNLLLFKSLGFSLQILFLPVPLTWNYSRITELWLVRLLLARLSEENKVLVTNLSHVKRYHSLTTTDWSRFSKISIWVSLKGYFVICCLLRSVWLPCIIARDHMFLSGNHENVYGTQNLRFWILQ